MILHDSGTDTREAVRSLGEGAHPMAPLLWERIVMGGCEDEDWSDGGDWSDRGGGYYVASVGRWIITRSSVGFIDAYQCSTVEAARTVIAELWDETDLDAAW